MKLTIFHILCIALSLFLNKAIALGGSLTLTPRMDIQVSKNHIDVKVMVTNVGLESAYKVGVKLRVFEETWTAGAIDTLSVKNSETFRFKPFLSKSQKGRYPITAVVTYRDENRYPFSTLACATFKVDEDRSATISATGADISINRGGNLIVKVKNTKGKSKKIRASLILPRGITSDNHRQTFQLDNVRKNIVFSLRNKKAQPGTQHAYYVFLEYDQEGLHYSVLVGGKIKLRDETTNWLTRTRWYWLAGLGVWVLIWGLFAVIRRWK